MQNPITGDPLSATYLKVIVLSGLALFILLFYVRGAQMIAELAQQYRQSKDDEIGRKLNLYRTIYAAGLGILVFTAFILLIQLT